MKVKFNLLKVLFISTVLVFSVLSCKKDESAEPIVYNIILSTTRGTAISPGESIVFELIDNNNRNIVNDSQVTFKVDGVPLGSNIFTSNSIGNYDITAIYDDVESNMITVNVLVSTYTQKALIENYTSTTCELCPKVSHSIDLVENEVNSAIPVSIHLGGNMFYEYSSELRHYFNVGTALIIVGSTPPEMVRLNRNIKWIAPSFNNIPQVINLASGKTDVGLSIASSRIGNNLSIDVATKFSLTHTEELKLVVYLLEDGLVETQANSTNFYGGTDILDMEHNHVLRKAYTAPLGDALPNTNTQMNDTYMRHFDVIIPSVSTGTSSNKLQLVAFIVDGETDLVLNVQIATVGTTQDFD